MLPILFDPPCGFPGHAPSLGCAITKPKRRRSRMSRRSKIRFEFYCERNKIRSFKKRVGRRLHRHLKKRASHRNGKHAELYNALESASKVPIDNLKSIIEDYGNKRVKVKWNDGDWNGLLCPIEKSYKNLRT